MSMKINKEDLEKRVGRVVRLNESMSNHTTFKIGGPAEYYIEVDTVDDLIKASKTAIELKMPLFVFGGGSNIVVSDKGIEGLVIKNNCRKFEISAMGGKIKQAKIDMNVAYVTAESGVIVNQLVRFCIENNMAGLEYNLGLPGTVGGAIFMNSNFPVKKAYIGDCLYSAKILDTSGEVREVDRSYFRFSYDVSTIQNTGEIVLSATFKMLPEDKSLLWQKGMEALNYRTDTQPKGASAGCTFRNISIVEAMTVPTPQNTTSAGYLIDKAGLKGKRIGDAMVSPLHANFILNMGNAKTEDVVELTKLIKEVVLKKFSVHLNFEVRIVGF